MSGPSSLSQLKLKHLQCRSWQHAWNYEISYLVMELRSEFIELHLRCMRCKTERIDYLERRTGVLVKRWYRHPDGYLVKGLNEWGGRKIFNANLRIELVSRYVSNAKPRKEKDGARKLPVHGKKVSQRRR